ncbi:MAG: CotH kinase family protein [Alistipes sp.]|nr:CotH kinase family protein [Alistipes sp.]
MKKLLKISAAIMSLMMLGSCSTTENGVETEEISNADEISGTDAEAFTDPEKTAPTEPETEFSAAPEPVEQIDGIPLLSISTVSHDENVMDFVTKTVNRSVAESIASWTPGYKMPPEPYYEECTFTLLDGDGSVLLDNVTGKAKVRGNWTTSYDKKPLRIKFDEKQSMGDLNGGAQVRNWVLLAEYKDGSLLRNRTALSISREILKSDGLYAADSRLVEVEINGNYWGIYLLADFQQINSNRVDITETEKGYTDPDIGYFLEFDGNFDDEDEQHSFHVDYAGNAALVPFDGDGGGDRTMSCLPEGGDWKEDVGITIKSDIYSGEQHDFIASYVNNVYNIMYYAAYEDKAYAFDETYSSISETDELTPEQAVEAVVDVQSLADMYIISELTCDADIYWSSFFMDVDFGGSGSKKLRFEAPWDFDSALGNKDRCADGTGFYAANIVPDVNGGPDGGGSYETINPWLAVLMYEDWYQEIIAEKWTEIYDSGVFSRAYDLIASETEAYSEGIKRNYDKWQNLGSRSAFAGELCSAAKACKTQQESAEYLSDWLESRVEFLNKYWHQ